jgi:type IV secretion system protein VirB2
MSTSHNRAVTFVLLAGWLALQATPALAQFTGAGTAATNWFVQLVTPIVSLIVGIMFLAALTKHLNWGWVVLAIIGIIGFFGRDQIVTMVRGWGGA